MLRKIVKVWQTIGCKIVNVTKNREGVADDWLKNRNVTMYCKLKVTFDNLDF